MTLIAILSTMYCTTGMLIAGLCVVGGAKISDVLPLILFWPTLFC